MSKVDIEKVLSNYLSRLKS